MKLSRLYSESFGSDLDDYESDYFEPDDELYDEDDEDDEDEDEESESDDFGPDDFEPDEPASKYRELAEPEPKPKSQLELQFNRIVSSIRDKTLIFVTYRGTTQDASHTYFQLVKMYAIAVDADTGKIVNRFMGEAELSLSHRRLLDLQSAGGHKRIEDRDDPDANIRRNLILAKYDFDNLKIGEGISEKKLIDNFLGFIGKQKDAMVVAFDGDDAKNAFNGLIDVPIISIKGMADKFFAPLIKLLTQRRVMKKADEIYYKLYNDKIDDIEVTVDSLIKAMQIDTVHGRYGDYRDELLFMVEAFRRMLKFISSHSWYFR